MPRKRRVGRPRKVGGRRKKGGSFIGKIKSGLSKAHNFLKKTKIISKVAGELSKAGVPYADKVGSVASRVGYGKRKRKTRK